MFVVEMTTTAGKVCERFATYEEAVRRVELFPAESLVGLALIFAELPDGSQRLLREDGKALQWHRLLADAPPGADDPLPVAEEGLLGDRTWIPLERPRPQDDPFEEPLPLRDSNYQERETLQLAWLRLLGGFQVAADAARQGFDELAAAYDEPGRFYHNLDHLADVLRTIDDLADLAWDVAAVRLAAWYHDAVYDPRALDNEERSAALAQTRCESWGLPRETIDTARQLILATKTHPFVPEDRDEAVLLDADLAIFGAGQERYNAYARAIRQEYQWVPEEDYRRGRLRILRSFLQKERIYRLERMQQLHEAAARENLAREIAALGG